MHADEQPEPPPALGLFVVVLLDERATAFASSSLNALRSAAFAKRTSLDSVSDGSFFPALSARSRSTASSRIVRAAAATR